MSNPVTIVTAFFDIGRAEKGDGRTISEYKDWIQKTLQLNCNLYIVTEEKFYDFFLENRPKHFNTNIKVIEFKDLHYNKYYDKIKNIIESDSYKNRIAYPDRVECKLPEYNIIQYSKFHCLQMAMDENPFKSDYFFWMDAGVSRFFLDVDISQSYPSINCINFLKNNEDKFIIQKRYDLETFSIDDTFVWKADNLLYGTMFCGGKEIILKIAEYIEVIFNEKMLSNNNANNEQLALALVWKENPNIFVLTNNVYGEHLSLFKLLSL